MIDWDYEASRCVFGDMPGQTKKEAVEIMQIYHKCARCKVADKDVIRKYDGGWHHDAEQCVAALQRELAKHKELLRECLPQVAEGLESRIRDALK